MLANRESEEGEILLGAETNSRFEPPYGSPGDAYSVHDGMIKEAVEDALAENELLRRHASDLENFSSARTASTRQYQSTGSRSVKLGSPEPDYSALDQLAEENGLQRVPNKQPSASRTETSNEGRQQRSLFGGLTGHGSVERWSALRTFLRFQPRQEEGLPEGRRQDQPPSESRVPLRRNSGLAPGRDQMPTASVGESSSRLQGLESASTHGPSVPQTQVSKAPPPSNTGITPWTVSAHARATNSLAPISYLPLLSRKLDPHGHCVQKCRSIIRPLRVRDCMRCIMAGSLS